jgi:hypothetical protein
MYEVIELFKNGKIKNKNQIDNNVRPIKEILYILINIIFFNL